MWPDEAVRACLYQVAQTLQRDCGGRLVKHGNLHQTLVFLGNVAAGRMTEVAANAALRGTHRFELEFGVTGYWRHNRLVWAAPHATPEPLRCLVAALQQGSQREGVRVDERPYASHVTLVRDARAPTALPPLAFKWPVRGFALVESASSAQGLAYRVLARWALSD